MNAKIRPLSMADRLIVKSVTRGRLTAIDALRGVAALCVILPHFVGFFSDLTADGQRLGAWMTSLGKFGLHGIDIFFVVSGFVIAFTTTGRPLTWRAIPNFMLRRLARLAPPYWVSIALMLMVLCLQAFVGGGPHRFGAAWSVLTEKAPLVAAHMVYVQDLLGVGNLNAVYWTLCIEVQFYLAFAVGLVVWRWEQRRAGYPQLPGVALLLVSWIVSVWLGQGDWTRRVPGTFVPFWHEFALGILACRLATGGRRPAWEEARGAAVLAVGGALALAQGRPGLLVALVTFALIWLLGRRGRLATALDLPALQFLGKISYSLYLTHIPVGFVFLGIKARLTAQHPSAVVDSVMFVLAVACSLGLATVFYRRVERPSTMLSRRFQPE